MEIAQKYLIKNEFIQDYFALRKSKKSLSELTEILKSDAYYPIKQYIVYQTRNLPFDERKVILETALSNKRYFSKTSGCRINSSNSRSF